MMTIKEFIGAEEVDEAVSFGNAETPIYAEVDGELREIAGVRATEIVTESGSLHSVIVVQLSILTATEAS